MGFIKEDYSNNRVGLIVSFKKNKTSANYYDGDSVEEAMKHFNIYLKNNELYVKTDNEQAITELGIEAKDAIKFRSSIDAMLSNLDDNQAINSSILFPNWQSNISYKTGDRIRYRNKLYKVLQGHTSQTDWKPSISTSLFAPLPQDELGKKISTWSQPDSTNGYFIGDKILFEGNIYESLIDNNVRSPETYSAGWQIVE